MPMDRNYEIEYKPLRPRKAQTIHDFFAVRSRGGIYFQSFQAAFRRLAQVPNYVHLRIFGIHLLRMLVGDRATNAVLSDKAVVVTGTHRGNEEAMYHFTPANCVESILSSGLLPKDRFVYLTDAPAFFEKTFLQWKTEQRHATTAYTLLKIDTRRLKQTQKIYCTDRSHEFVTGKIDADFISLSEQTDQPFSSPDNMTEVTIHA